MNEKKLNKFRKDYETKIKKYRDRYYEKLVSKEFKYTTFIPNYNAILITITFLVNVIILIIFHGILGDIIALLLATFATLLTRYIIKEDDNLQNNDFTRAIHKMGYFSVEAYDDKLTEYLTGACGVYQTELEEIKRIYDIDHETTILYAQNNDRYYAWTNKNTLYLLNTKITEKPEVKEIHLDRIRYYRFDKTQKLVILNTDTENYYFQPMSLEDIEELLPNKDFQSRKKFETEEYINDFEEYIKKAKKELIEQEKSCSKKKRTARNTAIATLLIMIICLFLEYFLPQLKIICTIIPIIVICPYILHLNRYYREYFRIPKNNYEMLKTIREDRKHFNRFNELKVSLGVNNTGGVIYTKDGLQHLTWVKDDKFYIFLNEIQDKVKYMEFNLNDIEYFKQEETLCEIKTKDKKLIFKPCAGDVLKHILKGKEYKDTK